MFCLGLDVRIRGVRAHLGLDSGDAPAPPVSGDGEGTSGAVAAATAPGTTTGSGGPWGLTSERDEGGGVEQPATPLMTRASRLMRWPT